jgi:hypothetical protein
VTRCYDVDVAARGRIFTIRAYGNTRATAQRAAIARFRREWPLMAAAAGVDVAARAIRFVPRHRRG